MDDISDLLSIDDSTFNWMSCPSSQNANASFSNSILEFVFSARYSVFFRYLIIAGKSYSPDQNDIIFTKPPKKKFAPLYQQIPASVIQIITNYFSVFYENQVNFIPGIHKFFSNRSDQGNLFSNLIFPSVFFYFQTKEFSELGFNFIEKNFDFDVDSLTKFLILSFFDCFPRFNNNLWLEFEFRCYTLRNDVFSSFRDSISISFSHLTFYHKKIISRFYEKDPKIFAVFFFKDFLLSRALSRFHLNNMDDHITNDLFSLLEFCSNNIESPHSQYIIEAILGVNNFDSQYLSFNENISFPTVFCASSPCEMQILYELFDSLELIKVKKLKGLIIPNEKRESMLPGYIQFSYKKIISGKLKNTSPLIFYNRLNCSYDDHKSCNNNNNNNVNDNNNDNTNDDNINGNSINDNNINNHNNKGNDNNEINNVNKSPIFSRIFKELYKVSFENSISIPSLLRMKDSLLMRKFLSLKVVYSPEFIKYVSYKLKKSISKSEQLFEDFMILLNSILVLSQITKDFLEESSYYMSGFAQSLIEFSLLKSKISENVNVEFTHPEGYEIIKMRYGNLIQSPTEKNIVKNSIKLKITDFPVTIPTTNNVKKLCRMFSAEFYFILLQIWSPEDESFMIFLKLLANQLLLSHTIDEKMANNIFFIKIMENIRSMKGTGIGRSFKKMNKILRDLKTFTQYNYDEYSEEKYAEVAIKALFHIQIMEPILTMIWFTRFSINIPMFTRMLDSTDSENWRIVSENIWSFVNNTDRVLIECLNEHLGNIPKYIQQD